MLRTAHGSVNLEAVLDGKPDLAGIRRLNAPVLETSSVRPILQMPEERSWENLVLLEHDAGPYLILGQAGRGLHGRVFRAYNIDSREIVALKMDAPTALGIELRAKRNTAVEDIARAESGKKTFVENVLPRYERVDDDGNIFFEMSYMDRFLSDIFEPDGNIKHLGKGVGKRQLYGYVSDIINGVSQIHKKWGVAYRDLKLSNCAITDEDVVLLTDFGLSSSGLTQSPRDNMGWVFLRPPENFFDIAPADLRYDSWNLGALIYRMCTGKYPLEDELQRWAIEGKTNDYNNSKLIQSKIEGLGRISSIRGGDVRKHGDDLLRKKIRGTFFKDSSIPGELRPLLEGLLRWDPTQRLGCADANVLWQGLLEKSERSKRRWYIGGSALGVASVAALSAALLWPADKVIATPQQLEDAKKYHENRNIYDTAPPLIMDVGTGELFRRMLKQSYDYAVQEVLEDRTIMRYRLHPPLELAFTPAQREEYDRRFAKDEAEQEKRMKEDPIAYQYTRSRWGTKYERMRNYVINEGTTCWSLRLYGQNRFDVKNRKGIMACALAGHLRIVELTEKYGAAGFLDVLDKTPEKVLTERDAKLLVKWSEAFDRANPISQWHPGYAPDPRFR